QVVAECPAMIRPPPPEVPAGPQELPTFLPPHRLLGSAPEGAALRPHFHDDQPAIVLDHQVDFPGAVAHVPLEQLESDQLQVQGGERLGGMIARHGRGWRRVRSGAGSRYGVYWSTLTMSN